jgi:hypothetical protein
MLHVYWNNEYPYSEILDSKVGIHNLRILNNRIVMYVKFYWFTRKQSYGQRSGSKQRSSNQWRCHKRSGERRDKKRKCEDKGGWSQWGKIQRECAC